MAEAPQESKEAASEKLSFESQLLRRMGMGGKKNFVASAWSINAALTILMPGAANETLRQMLDVMAPDQAKGSEEENAQAAEQRAKVWLQRCAEYNGKFGTKNCIVKIANHVYVHEKFILEKRYSEIVGDFATQMRMGDKARCKAEVDEWCSENTDGKITEIIGEDAFEPEEFRLLLLNAVYFKAFFEQPFDPKKTKANVFWKSPARSEQLKRCLFMQRGGMIAYEPDLMGHEVVVLPYKRSPFRLVLARPLADGVPPIPCEVLRGRQWQPAKLSLFVPKFKFQFQVKANDPLIAMGMDLMFHDPKADLTNFVANDKELVVTDVLHKCVIELNEKGTEAAAVTAVRTGVKKKGGKGPKDITVVRFDHPFDFYIFDEETGNTLFAGTLSVPPNVR